MRRGKDTSTPDTSSKNPQTSPAATLDGNQKIYYGTWEIKKVFVTGAITKYTPEEEGKFIGTIINYSAKVASDGKNECENPYYKERTYSEGDFMMRSKTNFKALGVKGKTIVEVDVCIDATVKRQWNGIGSNFYIRDENTLILFNGGSYFEMDRVG